MEDSLATVSLKLPQFWASKAATWFAQSEAQFALRGIVQETTKFYHVVAVLPVEVADAVQDLLLNPPELPYSCLKSRLLETYALDDFQRAEALDSLPVLGDQPPSHLLNSMLSLLPEGVNINKEKTSASFLFSYQFMKRLPVEVRTQLAHMDGQPIREVAKLADRIWSKRRQSNVGVSAIATQEEEEEWCAAATDKTRTPQPRQRTLCFFHRRFGSKARRCEKPCSWTGNDSVSRR